MTAAGLLRLPRLRPSSKGPIDLTGPLRRPCFLVVARCRAFIEKFRRNAGKRGSPPETPFGRPFRAKDPAGKRSGRPVAGFVQVQLDIRARTRLLTDELSVESNRANAK